MFNETVARAGAVRCANALAIVAITLIMLVLVPGVASARTLKVVQGESMRPSPRAQTWTARHGRVLVIANAAFASKRVRLRATANRLVLRARGRACRGPATAIVTLDGSRVGTVALRSDRYAGYRFPIAARAGRHRVGVGLVEDRRARGCNRGLYVDRITFSSTGVRAPGSAGTRPPGTLLPGGVSGPTGIPAAPGSPLTWAPPVLVNPTTITLGTGNTQTDLDNARDYVIKLPAERKGTTTIRGGHNVVIIGGWIHVPTGASVRRGIYVEGAVGTVHIEGVLIDNSGGSEGDGIAIDAPQATVQIENSRIVGVLGSQTGTHGDIVQPWGGVGALRIDRLTGSSNFQGLFLRPNLGPIGSVDVRNVDMAYDRIGAQTGGYLVWLTTGCTAAPAVSLSAVYISQFKADKSLATSVYPDVNTSACRAGVNSARNYVSWPTLPSVAGGVRSGLPPTGAFVPAGLAGPGYVSPGYGS